MAGKFIVFEGGEGAGKDTQIDLLREVLPSEEYVYIKSPGSTEVGVRLREVLLHSDGIGHLAELLVFLAACAQLVEELIGPALRSGKNVIANRFDLSTVAYQICGREHYDWLPLMQDTMNVVLQGIQPDVVILLDVPPQIGLRRAAQVMAADRFESEHIEFHERVRLGYLTHVKDYHDFHVIDALLSKEEVHERVRAILKL